MCKVSCRRSEGFSFPFPNLTGLDEGGADRGGTRTGIVIMSKMLGTNYCTVFSVLRSPEEGESFKRII